ncbi:hypothetical protein [Bacillus sp. AK031]
MTDTHETQPTEESPYNEDEIYSPVENLQKIEAGGTFKHKNMEMDTLPIGIRIIGYCIIGFIFVTSVLGLILSFFD